MAETGGITDTEVRGGARPTPRASGDEVRHLGAFTLTPEKLAAIAREVSDLKNRFGRFPLDRTSQMLSDLLDEVQRLNATRDQARL